MASLKELRKRISSIKSTQKITSAMKMVAAARLRKAQQMIYKSSFYAQNLFLSAQRVAQELVYQEQLFGINFMFPKLMLGNGKNKTYLLIVFSSDRGLCGGFNINIAKSAISRLEELKKTGKTVNIICVGRKVREILKRKYKNHIIETIEGFAAKGADYEEVFAFSEKVLEMFEKGEFDICEVITSKFQSAIHRKVETEQILPMTLKSNLIDEEKVCETKFDNCGFIMAATKSLSMRKAISYSVSDVRDDSSSEIEEVQTEASENIYSSIIEEEENWFLSLPELIKDHESFYDYEPGRLTMLEKLLPLVFRSLIFQATVHSQASEQGARMTSMDNATRNARDIISDLTLKYNGMRQSAITTELIEIISGAEAI